MNIACSILNRLQQNQIDELDNWHVILIGSEVQCAILHNFTDLSCIHVSFSIHLAQDIGNPTFNLNSTCPSSPGRVGLAQALRDLSRICQNGLNRKRNRITKFIDLGRIQWVNKSHLQHFIFHPNRNTLISLSCFRVEHFFELVGYHTWIDLHDLSPKIARQDLKHGVYVHVAVIFDDVHHRVATAVQLFVDFLQLQIIQHLLVPEQA